jgi:peptide deformylase
MAVLAIRQYPDPVLRLRCGEVESFDEELARLARDMIETVQAAPGIGLAAPQVGRSERLAVVDLSVGQDPEQLLVLVNPEIQDPVGSWIDEEGCLSIPELVDKVERPQRIRLTAQGLDGRPFELTAEGLLARAICHEVDHLDGVLFVDHLRGLRRERARRALRRLAREAGVSA